MKHPLVKIFSNNGGSRAVIDDFVFDNNFCNIFISKHYTMTELDNKMSECFDNDDYIIMTYSCYSGTHLLIHSKNVISHIPLCRDHNQALKRIIQIQYAELIPFNKFYIILFKNKEYMLLTKMTNCFGIDI